MEQWFHNTRELTNKSCRLRLGLDPSHLVRLKVPEYLTISEIKNDKEFLEDPARSDK